MIYYNNYNYICSSAFIDKCLFNSRNKPKLMSPFSEHPPPPPLDEAATAARGVDDISTDDRTTGDGDGDGEGEDDGVIVCTKKGDSPTVKFVEGLQLLVTPKLLTVRSYT